MVQVINTNEYEELNMTGPLLIDFSATWCGPCQMLKPIMEEVSDEMSGQLEFYNMDVDKDPDVAQKYSVMSIPNLVLIKDNKVIGRKLGFMPKEDLVEWIEETLEEA